MQITFSDYAGHPGATRVSKFPQFGMPAYKIEGVRPKCMTLTGGDIGAVYADEELNKLNDWFFNKCFSGMFAISRKVIIACDLPMQLEQWRRVEGEI